MSSVALQGTKVEEGGETRIVRAVVAEGTPPRQVIEVISKYTGALAVPKWKDDESGRVLFSRIPCERYLERKRQVPNVVPCQGRHLQRPVYSKIRGTRKDRLHAATRRNSTGGPHRAAGTSSLD